MQDGSHRRKEAGKRVGWRGGKEEKGARRRREGAMSLTVSKRAHDIDSIDSLAKAAALRASHVRAIAVGGGGWGHLLCHEHMVEPVVERRGNVLWIALKVAKVPATC